MPMHGPNFQLKCNIQVQNHHNIFFPQIVIGCSKNEFPLVSSLVSYALRLME